MKFSIKTLSLVASMGLAAFVAGCNSETTEPTVNTTTPGAPPTVTPGHPDTAVPTPTEPGKGGMQGMPPAEAPKDMSKEAMPVEPKPAMPPADAPKDAPPADAPKEAPKEAPPADAPKEAPPADAPKA